MTKPVNLARLFLLACFPWVVLLSAGCWGSKDTPGDKQQDLKEQGTSKSQSSEASAAKIKAKAYPPVNGPVVPGEILASSAYTPQAKGKGSVTTPSMENNAEKAAIDRKTPAGSTPGSIEPLGSARFGFFGMAPWVSYGFADGSSFKMGGEAGGRLEVETDAEASKDSETSFSFSTASHFLQKTIAAFSWYLYAAGAGVIVFGFFFRYLFPWAGIGLMCTGVFILVVLRGIEVYPDYCLIFVCALVALFFLALIFYALTAESRNSKNAKKAEEYKTTINSIVPAVENARLLQKGTAKEDSVKDITDQVNILATKQNAAEVVKNIVSAAKKGKLN